MLSLAVLSLLPTRLATAHLRLTSPPARHPAADLKDGPCGVGTPDARSTDPTLITTYLAGETITVRWTEVVDHDPSHYRIAFSRDGDTEFSDPTDYSDIRSTYPVLLDGIADADAGPGHAYSATVTLPSDPCDSCTLQVIQVMHDKPPWGPGGGDDIYYQCADIVLTENPDLPPPTGSAGAPSILPSGSGGSATDLGTGGTLNGPGIPSDGEDDDGDDEDAADAKGSGCSAHLGPKGPSPVSSLFHTLGLLFLLVVHRSRKLAQHTARAK